MVRTSSASARWARAWAATRLVVASTSSSASAWISWPIQRIRTLRTAVTPGTRERVRSADSTSEGSIAVHEPTEDVAGRGAQHQDDRDGDDEADDGVGPVPADGDAACTHEHREGGEAIGPRVVAVGDEGRRADGPALADAEERDGLVADEADESRHGDPSHVVDRRRVQEAVDGLPSGEHGRQGDHGDDEESGEVLGAAVAVGVTAGGGASAEDEGDPERDRGERVAEVVDRVGQQRHRPGDVDDGELRETR